MKQQTIQIEEMKNDLMRVYRSLTERNCYSRQKDAYIETVEHAAPRFYVDPEWAVQRLSPMVFGDFSGVDKMGALRRQMYIDLFHVVVELSRKARFAGSPLIRIVREAVHKPAPRFYISHARMEKIWKEKTSKRCKRRV